MTELLTKGHSIQLDESWLERIGEVFEADFMQSLKVFLEAEKQAGKVIYPKGHDIFNAFNSTPFDRVKVVILGQDPYHGPGQAHGLSFSVPEGVRIPPSLKNIYKEINRDLGLPIPRHGNLGHWAEQGVLLLNSVLTVEQAQAASHQGRGWEQFTDHVIHCLNKERDGLVFMLWGSYAQKKAAFVDESRHCVLWSVHPSPLSAHRGFLGCGHFSAANAYLEKKHKTPIDWSVDNEGVLL